MTHHDQILSDKQFLELNLSEINAINDLIDHDDPKLLREYLQKNPEYLTRNVFMFGTESLLGFAARDGKCRICEVLIELGADVNVSPESSRSPLDLAASKGYLNLVKLLLDAGACVDGPSSSIIPPLMSATMSGHVDVVEYLLTAGADPDRFHLRLLQTSLDAALIWKQLEIEGILRSVHAVSLLEGIDWSTHRYEKFITWIEKFIGRVLPVCFRTSDRKVEIRLALANKKKHKMLFTTGMSDLAGQPFEVSAVLPETWNPYDTSEKNLFPVELLEKLVVRMQHRTTPLEGLFVQPTDKDLQELNWPTKLTGVWIGKQMAEENPLIMHGKEVRQMEFFAVVPVKASGKKFSVYDPGAFQDFSFAKLAMPI
jgi:hypothetical protein